ncbi:CYFA0S06e00452g1_1 [Cyberlindnera fabianii]|uniref:CYFA0S06e00452g1_1 n=2 Tax=Cyberlindnera fabianii TaxID=36022 RepID=A0A061ATU1_CYBFA|nr:CYFA0S06e00452g1_1 [Cyberlindnera fabianii]
MSLLRPLRPFGSRTPLLRRVLSRRTTHAASVVLRPLTLPHQPSQLLTAIHNHQSFVKSRQYSTQPPSQSPQPPQSGNEDPNKSHMPRTKEEWLARATSFWQRLRVRSKWLLKRSMKPFNIDDFSAFFSWIVVGNVLLIVLGTTTFASLFLLTMNTVFAQELVAQTLGNFITKNSGLTVSFESAIVPDWREGRLVFQKCFVSKRPKNKSKTVFAKGSQAEAIAQAATVKEIDANDPDYDDGNYTQYDLTIETVSLSLSVRKFLNGKGIVKEMEVHGMRGVVDRTHVHWAPDDDARNYLNVHKPGDFEFENFKMTDVLITLMQPNGFRPFNVSIFNCELPILRKHWLFFDFLNATNISGAYDESLFTIHKRQRINDFNADMNDGGTGHSPWKRVTRCRVDSLNVDHLNAGMEGPFGWITSGEVDMIGDIMVPEDDGISVSEVIHSLADSIAKEARRAKLISTYKQKPTPEKPKSIEDDESDPSKYFVMDYQLTLRNPKAAVPIFTDDISYVNNALIRPIVSYINSRKFTIPIKCRIVKKIEDFEGSWTVYDSMFMDDISIEVYDAFANYVANEEVRTLRMKRIGFWSLQLFIQLLLMSLGAIA